MNKTLKLYSRGDLLWPCTYADKNMAILNFLNSTGFTVHSNCRLECDRTEFTVDVDFEVPEEPQDIETLDDVRAFFNPSMKIKIPNYFWQSSDIRDMRKVKSILLFMARSKYRFKIENNIGDDTTEITLGIEGGGQWVDISSFEEFYDQVSKVLNEPFRYD